ncbi:DUF4383 domain-containing protein [Halorussus sp. MSC15.2]|uniref:DUF4383 domain-containing protein n=1 Tax=Halorussus sp. MSC15.2 TaxID=2283638 RepID=UPI0013D7B3C1|nr:DUF4383 domain-containing protein [Halorussus sp. MSC15.2]NEU58501.1 DUF4383 domain-containing protein [Halorussus sp. MSC15.2]
MANSDLADDDRIPGGTQISVTVVLGGVLLVMGIVGFASGGQLLVFGVNPFHNVFHLLTGALAIVAGLYANGVYADEFNKTAGIVYGLLVIFQLVAPEVAAQLLNADFADLWLHVGLALAFGGVGFALPDRERSAAESGQVADRSGR